MYQRALFNDVIIRIADGACIPENDENADWREYQAWLNAGNEPEPAEEEQVR